MTNTCAPTVDSEMKWLDLRHIWYYSAQAQNTWPTLLSPHCPTSSNKEINPPGTSSRCANKHQSSSQTPTLPPKKNLSYMASCYLPPYSCLHGRNGEIIVIIMVSTLSPLSRGTEKPEDSKSNALSFSHFSSISRKTESSAAVHGGHPLHR